MTETSTAASDRRRPILIAAAAAAAALLAGGVALVATGDDEAPPRLDLSAAAPGPMDAGGAGRVAESAGMVADDTSAGSSMATPVTYVAGEELPDMGGSAPVYRLAGGDDDLRAIARHLGVEGDVTEAEGQRTIVDGDASVNGFGASWWYTSGQPYPGSEDVPPDAPTECSADAVCEEPARPEPERPADLPTQAEAEEIVRALAEAAGVDLTGARVTSHDNTTTWSVTIELALDGTVVPGWSVFGTVMSGGEVLDAGGPMGGLEEVGDYPLDTTRTAIDRLNEQHDGHGTGEPSGEPAPEPAPEAAAEEPAMEIATEEPASDDMTIMPVHGEPVEGEGEPVTVTLRSGELVYTVVTGADGTETYLVPVYLLDGESDRGEEWLDVFAAAVPAEFLGA